MHLSTYTRASDFLAVVQAPLEQNEVANNLMLGISSRLAAHPERIRQQPYFATVQDGEALAAAAVMTPPFGVVVYANHSDLPAALELIAYNLHEGGWSVPFVNGQSRTSDSFLSIWQALTGATVKHVTRERVYELTCVIEPQWPSGSFRIASESDIPITVQWIEAFQNEALPNNPKPNGDEWARAAIADGDLFFWEDEGRPVSMARRGRLTRRGASIGPVYTPPELRDRGYASAVTAKLSQLILDSGRKYAMLFTDLSNPTSNSIYQKIGYQPVCDYNEFMFA